MNAVLFLRFAWRRRGGVEQFAYAMKLRPPDSQTMNDDSINIESDMCYFVLEIKLYSQ